MWFCSSPFGIAHHSAKLSRVMISGHRLYIIRFIGALVRVSSLSQHCFVAFALSYRYRNTSFRACLCKIWKSASWWFDCQYACLWSIIALSGRSGRALKKLPSWQILWEKWFRRCIFTKLTSDLSTGCFAISNPICIWSSSTRQRFEAAERPFEVGSLSCSLCFYNVSCLLKVSRTFFIDLLARNQLKSSLWQRIS